MGIKDAVKGRNSKGAKEEPKEDQPLRACAGQITVYSIRGCPHCRAAKKLLKSLNLGFVEINLDTYPRRRADMVKRTQQKTVPQIFFNGRHLGGNAQLQELHESGQLEALIEEVCTTPPDEGTPHVPEESESLDADEGDGACGDDFTCEPDPFLDVIEQMQHPETGVDIKTRSYRMKSYATCFVGSEMVTWLVANVAGIHTRTQAVSYGQRMMDLHHFHHVVHDHDFKDEYLFYRFLSEDKSDALNTSIGVSSCEPSTPNALAERIRRSIIDLYDEFLADDGHGVDYQGIGGSSKWKAYLQLVSELQRVDISTLNRTEKIAFFINIYNALVIHAMVQSGPPSSALQRMRFFSRNAYRIGALTYSLSEIENGVLRGNVKAPFALRPPFGKNDARRAIALSPGEPRIHFALVCGAKSCPAIKTYSAENCEEGLAAAAEGFLDDESNCLVNEEKRTVTLSKILSWYQRDFGPTERMMLFRIAEYASLPKRKQLLSLMESGPVKVVYAKYDWSLNGST